MWMSDKPLVQQELASALAKIAVEFENQQNTLGYLQAFWMTMAREWHGIDYLRLDKFYFLCRQMITGTLKWLRSNQWSPELIRQCNRLLSAKENYGPLRYDYNYLPWNNDAETFPKCYG
jgi:ribosomal RNA-processing protein 1